MQIIRFASSILYKMLRSKRFLAGSVLKLMNIQVSLLSVHQFKYNTVGPICMWTMPDFVSGKCLWKRLLLKEYSIYKYSNLFSLQVNMRLKWVMENNAEAARLAREGQLLFGTLDTWLIYKLSGGKVGC